MERMCNHWPGQTSCGVCGMGAPRDVGTPQKCIDREVGMQHVIITTNATRGRGVEGDPIRRVRQIWSLDGDLLAEKELI